MPPIRMAGQETALRADAPIVCPARLYAAAKCFDSFRPCPW